MTVQRIGVVVPCYKVKSHVLEVLGRIGNECSRVYVVDDACPENSGRFVEENVTDPRVRVIFHEVNRGVGGAVKSGYTEALRDGMDIVVKVDGDGQMPPELIPTFVAPILEGVADYTKGNRFFELSGLDLMPTGRIFGNAILSFMSKISSGYWDVFDPTNGFTAIHGKVLAYLPLDRVSDRYFFESDMLFRLNLVHAVVLDIPMKAVYGGESSNLKIHKIVGEFLSSHIRNLGKRLFYNYFLRDLSVASFELVFGVMLISFGVLFGLTHWLGSALDNSMSTPGTVMLAGVSVIVGLQFLLSFLAHDIHSVPRVAIHKRLTKKQDSVGDIKKKARV